jgi:hypothetical protein
MSIASESIRQFDSSFIASVFGRMADEFDYCAVNGLVLSAGNDRGWLVRGLPTPSGRAALVAYVENSEDHVELVEVVRGFRWSRHKTLHDALESLVAEQDPRERVLH